MSLQETNNTEQPSIRPVVHHTGWIMLVILLAAFALRIYRLDAQSFWNDEGNSARIAERSVQLILEGSAADIHPP
ncbi:MAG: hypothetical protein JXA42_11285, partial [Anaerolineales bacterium]|nr:hypothetical protein [Anaerolineales bacterium]